MAEIELKRQTELLAKGVGTRKDYEQAESQVASCARGSPRWRRRRRSAISPRGPTRSPPPRRMVDQNQANLAQARKRLDDLMPAAPEDGLVENTFFNVGEWVPAGTPVVSLLPASRVKLRFFVPEEDVSQARMGRKVSFTCDGCPPDLKATIIYVSPRAEFTPPVIYSQSARSKLVFLIEARPDRCRRQCRAGARPAGQRRALRRRAGHDVSPSMSMTW